MNWGGERCSPTSSRSGGGGPEEERGGAEEELSIKLYLRSKTHNKLVKSIPRVGTKRPINTYTTGEKEM